MRWNKKNLGMVLLSTIICCRVLSQTVVRHPQPESPLQQRWEWAQKESSRNACKNGFWIGYSIEKYMDKNAFTGSFSSGWEKEKSLSEIIYGMKIEDAEEKLSDGEIIRRAARSALDDLENRDEPQEKVLKEVALLFQYSGEKRIEDVRLSNLCLHVDLKKLPRSLRLFSGFLA